MATLRHSSNQENNGGGPSNKISAGPIIRQGGRAVLGDLSNKSSVPCVSKEPLKPQAFTIYQDDKESFGGAGSCASLSSASKRTRSRAPLKEVDFWADKVAKLPLIQPPPSMTTTTHYNPESSISSQSEDDGAESMILDTSLSGDNWKINRVPPVSYSQVIEIQEYTLDIFHYLKGTESKLMPKWNYMTKQPDITFTMRSILVDWLVEVAEEYNLCTETLYLSVNYIDRFLSYMSVQRAKLQLVGTACMFIAAKYEEIYPPEVNEFTYITDDTYSKKQVLRMEHLVLKVLGFDLTMPTAYFFVNQFSKLSKSSEQVTFLGQYLSELTLLDGERYLVYTPSIVGAASLTLARHTCKLTPWPQEMEEITGYRVEDFQSCLVNLHKTFTDAPKSQQQAMREKYKQDKYKNVSEMTPLPISS
ncbi:cyclin-A2 [Lepeophtheirus salmonis]|nr:cyclin-A2-like [Lepeophtheirus salmonis]